MRFLYIIFTLLWALTISGCDREKSPERMTSGEELYNYYCKTCHENRGPGAQMEHLAEQEPMPPYKIILMIKYGYNKEKHSMPVFDQLSEEQADAVARHVVMLQMSHR